LFAGTNGRCPGVGAFHAPDQQLALVRVDAAADRSVQAAGIQHEIERANGNKTMNDLSLGVPVAMKHAQ
jgi:hypothetical protein